MKDLAKYDEAKLLKLENMGQRSIREVTSKLVQAWISISAAKAIDKGNQLALPSSCSRESNTEISRFTTLFGEPPSPENILAGLCYAPAGFLELSMESLNLSTRTSNVFRNYSIHQVKDLVHYDETTLLALVNMGRGSVREVIMKLFQAWFIDPAGMAIYMGDQPEIVLSSSQETCKKSEAALEEDPVHPVYSHNLKQGIAAALSLLTEDQAKIMRMRMGISGRAMTLQEIGDIIGVSRERIRQIERKCVQKLARLPIWKQELEVRLEGILSEREEALPLVGLDILDSWFQGFENSEDLFEFIFDNFCRSRFFLVREQGQVWVSKISQKRWNEVIRLSRQLLEARLSLAITEEDARTAVDALLIGAGEELRSELWAEVTKWAQFIALDNGIRRLVSLGSGTENLVEAILIDSDRPLHYVEIAERVQQKHGCTVDVRRVHNAAANVGLLLGRGTYGLIQHFPLLDPEVRLLVAEVEDLIESADPQKQWHCSEICAAMEERGLGFDERLTPYVMNIALERSKCLVNLGRMIWASRSTGFRSSANRIDIHQAIVSLLQTEGRPLPTGEIRRRLARERGVNDYFQIQSEGPLIRVGSGIWGLVDRDLPFSEASAKAIMDEIEQILEVRGKGLHVTEILGALQKTADLARNVKDATLFLALAQRTDRMRTDKGEYVYLADWEGSRRLSTREAIRLVLKGAGALGVTLDEVAMEVQALIERPLARNQIGYNVRNIGACYDEKTKRWSLSAKEEASDEEDLDLLVI